MQVAALAETPRTWIVRLAVAACALHWVEAMMLAYPAFDRVARPEPRPLPARPGAEGSVGPWRLVGGLALPSRPASGVLLPVDGDAPPAAGRCAPVAARCGRGALRPEPPRPAPAHRLAVVAGC